MYEVINDHVGADGRLQYRRIEYRYTPTESALAKSRYAFKQASALAATVMRCLIEEQQAGGILKSEKVGLEATAKALVNMIATQTIEPLVRSGFFRPTKYECPVIVTEEKAVGFAEQVRLDDHLQQPGADPQPHLDEERNKKKHPLNMPPAPATIESGVSKALEAEGFTYVAKDDEGSHWIHRDLKHEAIVRDGDFLLKSGWSGETVRGTEVEDVALALQEMDS
jgi:hypothetical protein